MRTLILSAAFLAAACGAPTDKVCTPGGTQACQCAGGKQGAQTCNLDGKSWGQCSCDGSNTTTGCTNGQSQTCSCTDGSSGTQTCANSAWGACACATTAPAVGKFCNSVLNNGAQTTMTLTVGSGAAAVQMDAPTGFCSTITGNTCAQIQTGSQVPLSLKYNGNVIVQASMNVLNGNEYVFYSAVDAGSVTLKGGALAQPYICSTWTPF